jgi:hypothetical protein
VHTKDPINTSDKELKDQCLSSWLGDWESTCESLDAITEEYPNKCAQYSNMDGLLDTPG